MAADPGIIAKIQALLETKGRTPEEAALYVAKANELAEKHGLSIYALGNRKSKMAHDVRETAAIDILEKGKPQEWRLGVLVAAANAAGVRVFTGWRVEDNPKAKSWKNRYRQIKTAYFVGLPVDVEVAGYTYEYLVREIERQAKEHAKPAWDTIKAWAQTYGTTLHVAESEYALAHVHPLKQEASFRKGAAVGVRDALAGMSATRHAADTSTTALVVDRDAAITEYLERKRWGDEYDAMVERREARRKAAEDAAKNPAPAAVTDPEARPKRWTKTDQKRLEASIRAAERAERGRQNRYWRGVDVNSWRSGEEAGRQMSVRPGIKGGSDAN